MKSVKNAQSAAAAIAVPPGSQPTHARNTRSSRSDDLPSASRKPDEREERNRRDPGRRRQLLVRHHRQHDRRVAARQRREERDAAEQREDRRAEDAGGEDEDRATAASAWPAMPRAIVVDDEAGDDAERGDGAAGACRRGAPGQAQRDQRRSRPAARDRRPTSGICGVSMSPAEAVALDERDRADGEDRRDHARRPRRRRRARRRRCAPSGRNSPVASVSSLPSRAAMAAPSMPSHSVSDRDDRRFAGDRGVEELARGDLAPAAGPSDPAERERWRSGSRPGGVVRRARALQLTCLWLLRKASRSWMARS